MNTSGDDYTYDNNGNMTADGNKGINVAYNLLNLPQQVWNGANEKIYYLYDASGRKLSQIVSNAAGAQTKLTDYHGEYIYENDTLRFANHEEGRVIMTGGEPEYQYHLKDHLGNVRMTFTTKDEADSARATLEDNHRTQDSLNFLNYRNARLVYSQIFDKTNGSSPGYAQRLSGAPNERIGLARSFSVMPGDKIKARVYAKYFEAADTTAALQTLFGFFANPAASGGVVIDGGGYSNAEIGSSLPWMGTDPDPDEELPKAYLNYIFINRDYDMNSLAFVAKQISEDALEDGTDGAHELLEFEEDVKEVGYVYVYLSNDGEEVREVYFDDFKVEHVKSPVIQSEDFYPFGLSFNSYNRENSLRNQYLYNKGAERQDELGLDIDLTKFRAYDPALGRWWQIDPLADHDDLLNWTPYNYSLNNPVRFNDPDGDFIGTLIGAAVGGIAGAVDAYRNGKDVLAGAAEGAVSGAIAGAIVDATVATGGGALVIIGAAAAGGALGNAVGDVTGQVVTNVRSNGGDLGKAVKNVNFDNTGKKALTGAVTGAAGGAIGAGVGKALGAASNSTKAVQGAMSKNINSTAETLNKMGASAQTTGKAVDKIVQGMGTAGKNTANTIAKTEAAATMATEGAIKTAEAAYQKKKTN